MSNILGREVMLEDNELDEIAGGMSAGRGT